MRRCALFTLITLLVFALPLSAQIKHPIVDDGTAVPIGSMVKINALGEISACGDNDEDAAGIVVAVMDEGGTDYYLLASSDIFPARLDAAVTAGDRLTTGAGGTLRTAVDGEVAVGWALEDGHATELRRAIISLDYPQTIDWDTLGAYLDTTYTGDNLGDHTATENLQMSGYWVSNDGDNEGLFIDAAGNVGIGTSTLGYKFVVSGEASFFPNDGFGKLYIKRPAWYESTIESDANLVLSSGGGADMKFVTSPFGEVMRLKSTGNVGIGTDSPDEDLEVRSSGFTYIRSTTTGDADAGIHLRATGLTGEGGSGINQYAIFIRGADESGDLIINEDYNAGVLSSTTRMIIQNQTGYVGIGLGADDPEALLHVRGDIFVDNGNGFVGANPAGTDSFYIYDPGDTTYLHSDNPLKITTQLHLGTVPDDAAGDTILTLSGNQVMKTLASSLGGGSGFQQLRADGSPWLTDSVTLVSGDVELTQTGDSIYFNVDWDTLSAYADTTVTNALLDTLASLADTSQIGPLSAFKVHRTVTLQNPTTLVWTGFKMTEIVNDESYGTDFSWPNVNDSSTVVVNSDGLYQFSGCVHFQNTAGSAMANVKVLVRMVQITNSLADTVEARCGQREWMGNLSGNYVNSLSYLGTISLNEDDLLQLQFYVDNSTANFAFMNDPAFDRRVSATMILNRLK